MADNGRKVRENMKKIKELNGGKVPEIDKLADETAALYPDADQIADAINFSDGKDGKKGATVRGGTEATGKKKQ